MTQPTFIGGSLLDDIDAETSPTVALATIGGSRAVAAVVAEFYSRLQSDPVTSSYFASLDLDRLRRHQVLMLVKVLGGPDRYTGRDLALAHRPLSISPDVYRRVCLYLLTVMHELKVPMDVLATTDAVLASVEDQIVSGGGP